MVVFTQVSFGMSANAQAVLRELAEGCSPELALIVYFIDPPER